MKPETELHIIGGVPHYSTSPVAVTATPTAQLCGALEVCWSQTLHYSKQVPYLGGAGAACCANQLLLTHFFFLVLGGFGVAKFAKNI